uniref:Methyltransferase like 25B n=1 Tax=Corvus moneduloides TaxID=1196302 RepID=A0A8U7P032_CORMO
MPGVPAGPVTSRVLEGAAMAAAPRPAPHPQQQHPEQRRAADIIRLLTLYRPLLDAFVIDFFTEDLWAQLPPAWQPALASASPAQLAGLLGGHGGPGAAWPLSLLAFAAAARALAFPRGCPGGSPRPPCQSSHLHPLLRRHVKPKKQHEIQRLGKLLQRLSQATSCERVVDIGAGQVSTVPLCPCSTPGSPRGTWCWWPHGPRWPRWWPGWTRTARTGTAARTRICGKQSPPGRGRAPTALGTDHNKARICMVRVGASHCRTKSAAHHKHGKSRGVFIAEPGSGGFQLPQLIPVRFLGPARLHDPHGIHDLLLKRLQGRPVRLGQRILLRRVLGAICAGERTALTPCPLPRPPSASAAVPLTDPLLGDNTILAWLRGHGQDAAAAQRHADALALLCVPPLHLCRLPAGTRRWWGAGPRRGAAVGSPQHPPRPLPVLGVHQADLAEQQRCLAGDVGPGVLGRAVDVAIVLRGPAGHRQPGTHPSLPKPSSSPPCSSLTVFSPSTTTQLRACTTWVTVPCLPASFPASTWTCGGEGGRDGIPSPAASQGGAWGGRASPCHP